MDTSDKSLLVIKESAIILYKNVNIGNKILKKINILKLKSDERDSLGILFFLRGQKLYKNTKTYHLIIGIFLYIISTTWGVALDWKVFDVEYDENLSVKKDNLPYSFRRKFLQKINFGVVKNNGNYQLYRSKKLGEEGLKELRKHLEINNLPFPRTIIYLGNEGYKWTAKSDKFAIDEFKLQDLYGYDFFHSYGDEERTYIDELNPYFARKNIDDEKYIDNEGKDLFSISKDDKADGGVSDFTNIMRIILNPNRNPVLFHGVNGTQRTGMIALALRYLEGGEWIFGPKKNIKIWDVEYELNPAQFEYYKHNKKFFKKENIDFIEKYFKEDEDFNELKRNYQDELRSL
jgi:hypothetical protein